MTGDPGATPWYSFLFGWVTLFRGAVACVTLTAGLFALFADRALVDRKQQLSLRWRILRGTPLETKQFSPWGYKILITLVLAATLQFCGDWLKDKAADFDRNKKLKEVSESIGGQVSHAITDATNANTKALGEATAANQKAIGESTSANKKVIEAAGTAETTKVATNIGHQLSPLIQQLYPFSKIGWSWELKLSTNDPAAEAIRQRIAVAMLNDGTGTLEIPAASPSSDGHSNDSDIEQIGIAILHSASLRVRIANAQDNPLLGEGYGAELLAPTTLPESRVANAAFPVRIRCFDVGGHVRPTVATMKPDCSVEMYENVPLETDPNKSRTNLHHLSDLVKRNLSVMQLVRVEGESNILTLKRLCLYIRDRQRCYGEEELVPGIRIGQPGVDYEIKFPDDLPALLRDMLPGPTGRVSLAR